MKLPSIKDVDVKGKRIFLRADLDVPLTQPPTVNPFDKLRAGSQQTTIIEDDTRLKAMLPTVEYLLIQGATVIVAGHLGRPRVSNQEPITKNQKQFSLEPVAKWLTDHFNDMNYHSEIFGGFAGWEILGNLFLLENLRFYEGEEENDGEFSKKLASLADIYVDDAFTVIHRNHASVVAVAKLLPHFAGLQLQKEIEVLSGIVENPKRPLVVTIGGAKVETKLPLIEKIKDLADYVLVGGKLPQEQVVQKMQSEKVLVADLTPDGTDITEGSINRFKEVIGKAAMVVWNGPMGVIQNSEFRIQNDSEQGTREVAQAIVTSSAYKIVGGGDTVGYLQRLGIIDKFDFVSTGGGAMLAFLSGEKLPGLEALLS